METNTPVKTDSEKVVPITTPAKLLELAISQPDFDITKLEKLLELQQKWEAKQAMKAFFESLAKFQNDCPEITKTKKVDFPSSTGGRVNYNYAPISQIIKQIKKPLADNGLSYRFDIDDKDDKLVVTCILTHKEGHSEKTTMRAGADVSGKKNAIQSRGSTVSYLQRYTLIGVIGLGTADEDVDGAGTPAAPRTKPKQGQAKKENGVPADVANLITTAKTLDELTKTCKANKEYQTDANFKQLVTAKMKKEGWTTKAKSETKQGNLL